jgi:hypothetical protein
VDVWQWFSHWVPVRGGRARQDRRGSGLDSLRARRPSHHRAVPHHVAWSSHAPDVEDAPVLDAQGPALRVRDGAGRSAARDPAARHRHHGPGPTAASATQELYIYFDTLGWSYVIRFRQCILVTGSDGQSKPRERVGSRERARQDAARRAGDAQEDGRRRRRGSSIRRA